MRVDLILIDRRSYTFEAYAASEVSNYFEANGIPYEVLYLSEGGLQDYLYALKDSPPNWTMGFSNLTPHQIPLCDAIRIPHFYWVEDSLAPALHFLGSQYGKVGLIHESLCERFNAANLFYLPHGVKIPSIKEKKRFDTVFFADLIDPPFLKNTWQELFSSSEISQIELGLQDPILAGPYYPYAEQYRKACETVRIVKSFQTLSLDVFGDHAGNNWLRRLPSSIHLHASLPYSEHFEVLKMSRIAILDLSSPWYWPAVAADCLPLAPNEEIISQYLANPMRIEKDLIQLQAQLSARSWEHQTRKLIGKMA